MSDEEIQSEKTMFIPIRKVNEERHEVYGWAAVEEPDNSDEIMDYATSKPLFQDWSSKAQKRSGGKSLGNVRAMHGNIAAGKLVELRLDDKVKGFYVGAKIVDDAEWKKVDQGVYTGFSIGGSYLKRWSDYNNPGKIRYTAKPNEISIVDSPCITSATFEVVKVDGLTVKKEFQPGKGVNMLKLDRVTEMTADEQRAFLQSKLADAFPYLQRTDGIIDNVPPNSGSRYWLQDFSKDCVYVGLGEKHYSIPYTVDEANNVTFGVVTEVIMHVTYEPMPASTESVGKMTKADIPGSPEPIADIPLPSMVGPDYVVEHTPPPNALLEIKPNAEPPQEILAAHAVATKNLDAAMAAWLPKIGHMVKSAVAEEFKAAADLNKSTPTAPALIPVYRRKLINVRKEK
jgi:hypothetical protein